MFDISFSELLIIAIVALVVIGPERLPKVARTLGHLVGRFQRYVAEVKSSVEQEIHTEELRKLKGEVEQGIASASQTIHQEAGAVGSAMENAKHEVQDQLVFADEAPEVKPSSPSQAPAGEPENSSNQFELDLDSSTDKHRST